MPCTNGRLFDPSVAAFNATNASAHMCSSSTGPYREVYHTTGLAANISFFLADPADGYWREIFVAIAKQMRQAGVATGGLSRRCPVFCFISVSLYKIE